VSRRRGSRAGLCKAACHGCISSGSEMGRRLGRRQRFPPELGSRDRGRCVPAGGRTKPDHRWPSQSKQGDLSCCACFAASYLWNSSVFRCSSGALRIRGQAIRHGDVSRPAASRPHRTKRLRLTITTTPLAPLSRLSCRAWLLRMRLRVIRRPSLTARIHPIPSRMRARITTLRDVAAAIRTHRDPRPLPPLKRHPLPVQPPRRPRLPTRGPIDPFRPNRLPRRVMRTLPGTTPTARRAEATVGAVVANRRQNVEHLVLECSARKRERVSR
jgi:hypothetical protein